MFNVNFIYEDSSKKSWLVEAPTEVLAINTVLNRVKVSKNPKFVVVEKPELLYSETDINLLDKCESWCGEFSNVYSIENKLAKIVEVGGVKTSIGSLANFDDILKVIQENTN